MVYYIAFVLFSTISYGDPFRPGSSLSYTPRHDNQRKIWDAEGCSWHGTAPFCPKYNKCPEITTSDMLRLDCLYETSEIATLAKASYYEFGNGCWSGTKSYCCPMNDVCQWVSGDGNGSSEKKIGLFTGKECVEKCMAKGYDGATIKADGSAGCWCEKGMTGVTASSTYKSCLFKVKSDCKYDASNDVESGVGTVSESERLKAINKELQDTLRAVLAN